MTDATRTSRAPFAAFHIARRDLLAAAGAPLLWLILAAWLAVVHGAFVLTLLRVHGSPGSSVPLYVDALWWGALVLTLFAPALTMNAWSAERSQGTWQLLMTAPVRSSDLVIGKFLAAWGLLLVLIAATIALPGTLAVFSAVAPAHLLACYLGLVLMAGFLAALGTWIGLLVEGPVAAYVLTFGAVAVLWLASAGGSDGAMGIVSSAIGLGDRIRSFLAGRISLGDALWFTTLASVALVLAAGAIEVRRQSGSATWWRRAGVVGGPTLAVAVFAIAAIAAAQRAGLSVDLSADHRFSVAPALARQLSAGTAPIDLIGVWDDADDQVLSAVGDAGKRMAEVASRGSWRRLDPARHRPQLADFAAKHGDPGPPALWVVRGERAQRIPLDAASRLTVQREVAGALIALADPAPPVVRLTQGHGELRPRGGNEDGADQFAAAVHAAGLGTAILDDAAPAPPPTDVLAVLGPTAPLGATALARLEAHLRDGGGLLVLADDRAPTDLARWLGRRGIIHGAGVPQALVERNEVRSLADPAAPLLPARHLVSLARHVIGQEHDLPHHNLLVRGTDMVNPQSPLTAQLVAGGLQLVSPFTTACEAIPPQVGAGLGLPAGVPTSLLRTAEGDSWERARGEPLAVPKGIEDAASRGLAWSVQYAAAADAASAARSGRLVVWGSRQAASDAILAQGAFANGRLLAASCRWLAGREPPPEVPEAELRAFQIAVSDRGLDILVAALAVLAPVLCLGGAIIAWLEQRR